METFDTLILILDSTVRLSVPLMLAALAGFIPSGPAFSTSALRARCSPPPLPAAPPPRSRRQRLIGLAAAIARLGLPGAGARFCLDHPARQPDRLRRCDQLHRARRHGDPRPGLVPPGRADPAIEEGARFPPSSFPSPPNLQTCAGHRLDLFEPAVGPFPADLSRLCAGAVHLVGALPHPLRPAAARRGRKSLARSTRPASRSPGCATGRSSVAASCAASPAPICRWP
jgi:hypothetical protein